MKENIKSIFQEYGTIDGVLSPSRTSFAYVLFCRVEDAEKAILGLHDTPPLHLKVQLCRDKQNEVLDDSDIKLGDTPDFRYQEHNL